MHKVDKSEKIMTMMVMMMMMMIWQMRRGTFLSLSPSNLLSLIASPSI